MVPRNQSRPIYERSLQSHPSLVTELRVTTHAVEWPLRVPVVLQPEKCLGGLHRRTSRCVGPPNKTKSVRYNQRFVTAPPDIHFEVLHVLAEGDHVLVHWTGSGTHAERLASLTGETIPPTRRRVKVSGALLTKVRDGKIVRH